MTTALVKPIDTPVRESGFWNDDVTGKLQQYSVFLTRAMEADERSFVLCVDATWGLGKTFFVRRWAKSLRDNEHKAVAEFNAWQHDCSEDPLLPFVASITEQLQGCLESKKQAIDAIKQKAGGIAIRTGGLLTRALLRKFIGDKGVDELKELLSPDTTGEIIDFAGGLVDDALANEKAREEFRDEFKKLLEMISEQKKPIFIFIDELDRCNPRFAVAMLERIKHLFEVEGVKFIVSVDSTQIAHSIRGAYGQDFDATTYLQRFFDQSFSLPYPTAYEFARLLFKGIDLDLYSKEIITWNRHDPAKEFAELSESFNLTLRQQQQCFERMKAIIPNIQGTPIHLNYLIGLIIFRLKFPSDYKNFLDLNQSSAFWRDFRDQKQLKFGGLRSVEIFSRYIKWVPMSQQKLQDTFNQEVRPSSLNQRNEEERFKTFCREIQKRGLMQKLLTGEVRVKV